MPRYIVKLDDYYLEWSTVVDAPVTFGMSLDGFRVYYQAEYGNAGLPVLMKRLERVESKGISSLIHESADDLLTFNRAGPNESTLTRDEILTAYCLMKPIRDGWMVPTCG